MKVVKVTGVREVIADLNKVNNSLNRDIPVAMDKISVLAEGEVKQSIAGRRNEPMSVKTGEMMRRTVGTHGRDWAKVENPLFYSRYLEYGTSRLRPRRHFRNSLARLNSRFKELIRDAVKKATK